MEENKNLTDWLLIADGTPLPTEKLNQLAKGKRIIILDGVYNYLHGANIVIDILLGDFDTIDAEFLAHAQQKNITIINTPDQHLTDLEKAIIELDHIGAKTITICGATGRRLQHTLYNLRLMKKFYRQSRPITVIAEYETIQYVENTKIMLSGKKGQGVGLLGFPEAVITTSGLKYDVVDYLLRFALSASVSNALAAETVVINVQGNALVIHENQSAA